MKILILGSNGYLGSNFSLFLREKNLKVYHSDIHESPIYDWMNYHQINLLEFDFEEFFQNKKIDFIYLFSGLTGTLGSFKSSDKFIEVNTVGVSRVLQALINLKNQPTIIFPSTRLVYQGSSSALKEEANKQLNTPYAISKFSAENLIQAFERLYQVNFYIFRISIPYGNIGSSDYSFGTIGSFIEQLKENGRIILFGDGLQKRTFTSIVDICTIFNKCMSSNLRVNEIYNIGGEELSLNAAAEIIAGDSKHIFFKEWPNEYLRIESWDTVFCSEKLDVQIDKKYLKLSEIQDFKK